MTEKDNTRPSRTFKSAALLVTAVIASVFSADAKAQMELARACPTQELIGAPLARGAIIWNHGYDPDGDDSLSSTPPYICTLQKYGWDAYRFNRNKSDDVSFERPTDRLVELAMDLAARGYHNIAAAGQSFGAFLALRAAIRDTQVKVVIATAPAGYREIRRNADDLYAKLGDVPAQDKVLLAFFKDDEFDPNPGERRRRSREIMTRRGMDFEVLDQPFMLEGHNAAAEPDFGRDCAGLAANLLDNDETDRAAHRTVCQYGPVEASRLGLTTQDGAQRPALRPATNYNLN